LERGSHPDGEIDLKNLIDDHDANPECATADTHEKIMELEAKKINCLKFNGQAKMTLKTYDAEKL